MWTRALLKNNAKNVIRRRGWIMVLAAGVYSVVSGLQVTMSGSEAIGDVVDGAWLEDVITGSTKVLSVGGLLNIPLDSVWAVGLFTLVCGLIRLLVLPVLEVGYDRFLMESRQGNAPFATLAGGFSSGNSFGKIWITQLIVWLKIFLWTMLLIVPGIIKAYQYSQVPYLLAENPWLTSTRAQEISRRMTDGEKWKIFVLDLSFVGWYLLAALVAGALGGALGWLGAGWLGIGTVAQIAVHTYRNSTKAELYAALRAKADAMGILQPGELAGFVTYQ